QAGVLDLPAEELPVPGPLADEAVGAGQAARGGEQQRDGQLGGRDVVGLRRVEHEDPAPAGGVEVDVVDPHPAPPDDPQAGGAAQERLVHLGAAAGDERVVLTYHRKELLAAYTLAVIDRHA